MVLFSLLICSCNDVLFIIYHEHNSIDAQPSNPQTGPILVTVTGRLLVDDEQNPQQFSQTFQLVPEGSSYFVFNDIFRLNYGY